MKIDGIVSERGSSIQINEQITDLQLLIGDRYKLILDEELLEIRKLWFKYGIWILENIVICHRTTNEEKADNFPHWTANGKRYKALRVKKNTYKITEDK